MRIFDILTKRIRSKDLQSKEILSQEEYKSKFLYGDEYVKREYYNEYITQRLAEEFDLRYNEKTKRWCSEWNNNQRFVVELYRPKGTHVFLLWGYNYDFIPDINRKNKLVWHRTDSSVTIHLEDFWNNHIEHSRDQEWGFSAREFYNPEQCPVFQYEIPTYTSDIEFALKYIKKVVDKNILLMKEWVNNVKSIDDAIEVMNQRVLSNDIFSIRRTLYIRAFLHAKNKNVDEAMSDINKYYDGGEIPEIIINKLSQIAGE